MAFSNQLALDGLHFLLGLAGGFIISLSGGDGFAARSSDAWLSLRTDSGLLSGEDGEEPGLSFSSGLRVRVALL